jgi:hypothetical protein
MPNNAQPPSILDIPLKVDKPPQPPTSDHSVPQSVVPHRHNVVRAVLKYRNDNGRKAILSAAKIIHHDFGAYNESLSVSVLNEDLEKLKSDDNVEWFEGDGKVIYCSIR